MKKTWRKPRMCETAVSLEVTAYQSADIAGEFDPD